MEKVLLKLKNNRTAIILMLAFTALCLLLLYAGCQIPDSGRDSLQTKTKLEEIRERGVLKVGTAGDYQPMSYLDPDTGCYTGFDAELAEDAAALEPAA